MKFIPTSIYKVLRNLAEAEQEIYVAGGPIRDSFLERPFKDIDLTLPKGAREIAQKIARNSDGHFIPLDEEEGVFRVAINDFFLDFSNFRQGSSSIEKDLGLRDFTVNAMAVTLKEFLSLNPAYWNLIDPFEGKKDLSRGLLRALGRQNFLDDPLRMLRGYRLAAELGFTLDLQTRKWIKELHEHLNCVAKERIAAELERLFSHPAGKVVWLMAEDYILFDIFPELEMARGVAQPTFHHLDVFEHLLLALEMADLVLESPKKYFGEALFNEDPFVSIKKNSRTKAVIRLAALFHDIGKPHTFAIRHRITFYEHDRVGAEIFFKIGERLRFSKKFKKEVAHLIRHHMRPFHLLHEFRAGRLSRRAMRRLIKDVPNYPALFMVAMADSLASAGPDKESNLEKELAELFWEIHRFNEEILIKQEKERLVTGQDLIDLFGLEPGPIFRELLEAVEEARSEGKIKTREEALSLLGFLIQEKFGENFK
ncbi:CCA tRNA nucleotidyltransferase [Thermodesulfatator indicus]